VCSDICGSNKTKRYERTYFYLNFLHFDCPTTEQKNALLAMQDFIQEENEKDFLILCGAAGTGKTSITSALIGYMNQKDVCYRIAAPTGRACSDIGEEVEYRQLNHSLNDL
jgi:exodeoxyribonuclease-5